MYLHYIWYILMLLLQNNFQQHNLNMLLFHLLLHMFQLNIEYIYHLNIHNRLHMMNINLMI